MLSNLVATGGFRNNDWLSMETSHLGEYWSGWFVGDFSPTFLRSDQVEVALKHFSKGDTEPRHYQLTATEISLVVSGRCRIGEIELGPDEMLKIYPMESADFEALTDVTLVAVKIPSTQGDKRLGDAQ